MSEIDRRTLLKVFQWLLLMVATPLVACKEAFSARLPTRTVELKNFRFDPDTGNISWSDTGKEEPYELVIDGLVKERAKLMYAELRALPRTRVVKDFHCVEGWTVPQVQWTGFRFKELLNRVQPDERARYVTFHSLGETGSKPRGQAHYVESFELAGLLNDPEDILLALSKDGKPLSQDRGAPLRVIAPYRLAYKSIKFVSRIEFSDRKQLGWWTLANPIYDWKALVPGRRLRKG